MAEERERQTDIFDILLGLEARDEGMELAAETREVVLDIAREAVRESARRRPDRTATIDDAYREIVRRKLPTDLLGPAAGSVFKGGGWRCIGWIQSERVQNHGRAVRLWVLEK